MKLVVVLLLIISILFEIIYSYEKYADDILIPIDSPANLLPQNIEVVTQFSFPPLTPVEISQLPLEMAKLETSSIASIASIASNVQDEIAKK
jgi:hypothetical protein